MRTAFNFTLGTLLAIFMIVAPIVYQRMHDREFRNFHVVQEGVLYRSGQLPLHRLQRMVHQYGIRTVISLREGQQAADELEEQWVKARALKFVRIPYRAWSPDATGKVPAEQSIKTLRDIMDDPANHPVLVHCFAGIHRTGTMCAIYRMDYQGWTNVEAMKEMRALGYTILDQHEDVHGYMLRYRSPPRERAIPAVTVGFKKQAVP